MLAPTYGEVVRSYAALEVPAPTSRAAEAFVRSLPGVTLVHTPYTATSREEFLEWAGDRKRLLMEDFYRSQRLRHDLLMEGGDPVGGRWNLDHDNREPAPRGVARLDLS